MSVIAYCIPISIRAGFLTGHLGNILHKHILALHQPGSVYDHGRSYCSFDEDNKSLIRKMAEINGMNVAAMRKPYKAGHETFTEDDLVAKEPLAQFAEWFRMATQQDCIGEANAMTLATATKEGRPSARMVLLKGFDKQGFRFFTNYESRKGRELLENPYASLCFYWESLSRSVRVEGRVERLTEKDSTEYFHSRPPNSQIGAVVSRQSTVVENRDVLTAKDTELKEKYLNTGVTIPKPDYWGGFQVIPDVVEFWQGQSNRLHDRIIFRRPLKDENIDNKNVHQGEDGWVYERLSP